MRQGAAEPWGDRDTRADARLAPRTRLPVLRSPVRARVPPQCGPGDVEAVTELPASSVARPRHPGSGRPSAAELLSTPGALLTRSHLRDLGLGRSAIDAVFRELDVVVFPGSSRPHVRAGDYLELVERSTYSDGRVRLTRS